MSALSSCAGCLFFFFRQRTAYDMRISDWSSDVCSSDLLRLDAERRKPCRVADAGALQDRRRADRTRREHGFDAAFCEQTLAIANEFKTAHPRAVHAQAIAGWAGHGRSEERRVGKEWVSRFRTRWSRDHSNNTN